MNDTLANISKTLLRKCRWRGESRCLCSIFLIDSLPSGILSMKTVITVMNHHVIYFKAPPWAREPLLKKKNIGMRTCELNMKMLLCEMLCIKSNLNQWERKKGNLQIYTMFTRCWLNILHEAGLPDLIYYPILNMYMKLNIMQSFCFIYCSHVLNSKYKNKINANGILFGASA